MINKYYEIRCPECNMPIKRLEDINVSNENFVCYLCEKEITLHDCEAKIVFKPSIRGI